MKIREQFSKYAKNYHNYSKIQQEGAQLLVENLPNSLGTILDIGCGSGRIYNLINSKNITYDKFYGSDFSANMIQLHPQADNVTLDIADFNTDELSKIYSNRKIDIAISSSALQWAEDINATFKTISSIAPMGAFFIFTSGTFKTLHKIANVKSPIVTKQEVLSAFNANYNELKSRELNFKLEFNTTLDMLRYIKKSGVSGGGFNLSYLELKRVIKEYNLNYLEFEALLLIGESRWK